MWGMRDKQTIEIYGKNIAGVHKVIPQLLEIFKRFNIRATFATVGLLFFENKQELFFGLPVTKPKYIDSNLSPYNGYFDTLGYDYRADVYHYAPELIRMIQKYPGHEIGTHTFSHYYCLEEGQTAKEFEDDLKSGIAIAKTRGVQLSALVFPRNQFNDEYLQVCKELGIICYRGNQYSWLYKARNEEKESLFRRALRLIDAYVNISGHNCYQDKYLAGTYPVDIPATRFLRPYSKKLKAFEGLRLNRIKSGMKYAAKKNMTYHLWWHPHNFGINQKENFAFLERVLEYYQVLHQKYNFQSYTMTSLAKEVHNG
jgi:peptidoglycan/xylan/chitin deacetylase (PgdA/CDA1 family)